MTAPSHATKGPSRAGPVPPDISRAQGPEPRTSHQPQNSATTGPGAGSLNVTHQNVIRKCAGRGQAHVEDTSQVNYSRNSVPTNRTGRTRTPNLMEYSTESTDGKYFQISTRFTPCNKFGIYPLRTRTCYQREHNQALQADAIFSQPFAPVGRFTHSPPMCSEPSPPRPAAPVILPPTHHIWFSLTDPGPSAT